MAVISLQDKAVTGLRTDPKLWIAVGRNRYESHWQNREVRWSVILGRLKRPTMTQETQTEYLKMSIDEQGKVKDVGGFVGGVLKDGKRRSDTVMSRSMITFDLDRAPKDFVDRMQLSEPVAWAIYSTHKHKPDSPRMRMLIPLARTVTPEEYEAIGRKIAEDIGLEFFDSTTFQASRLMYWPSCSRDAQYVFEYHDDDLLDPDEVLKRYAGDWHDISLWPVCPDEVRVDKKRTDKKQDPLQKKGPVGIFCRTYTVPEAIDKFLPDIYKPTDKSDRYTYSAGSTFGGLVIYDDGRFCYSNHSTDPAHGMDLNAFDLVRIHKFRDDDANAKEDTPVTKLPSYKKMCELIDEDPECKKTIDAEREKELEKVFSGEIESGDQAEWKTDLQTAKGHIIANIFNLRLILLKDAALQGIRFNELSQTIENTEPAPWEDGEGPWKNSDDSGLYMYLSLHYADFKRNDLQDVLTQVARSRRFHPIKDYLNGLPAWDGVARAETLLIRYLGAEDNRYVRAVTRKWLLGAMTRVFKPGTKFDWCLTLTGEQGIGKSTLAAKLGGAWFSDSLSFEDMRDEKTAGEKLRGEWIMEIGEMKGLRKTDVESVKSFLSRAIDKYRPAYAKKVESYPRSCVFIGSGNNIDFLKDPTGNRRFWPVHCHRRRDDQSPGTWDITDEEIGQIWAEVKTWYDKHETLELSKDVRRLAELNQMEATEQDDRAGAVEIYLDTLLPETWDTMDLNTRRLWLADREHEGGSVKRTEVSVMEIWAECFHKDIADKRRSDSDDIARMLKQLEWTDEGTRKRLPIYGQQRVYTKK